MCNHDNKDLIGVEGGIKCRACGQIFPSFKELEVDRKKSTPQEPATCSSEDVQETFEPVVKEKDVQEEKPVKKASDAKSGTKAATKKATSKKGAK